jgi:hypothetical protein
MNATLRAIARALDDEVFGGQVLAPGPGHGKRDRSLSVRLSSSGDDFLVYSFAGDDWRTCRDHVRERLGLLPCDNWKQDRRHAPAPRSPAHDQAESARERAKAQWLWRQRKPIALTIAETCLRRARGYGGVIPPTLAYLPPSDSHEPALIAAFGMTTEPEPGMLEINDDDVRAVQLIKLNRDGSGKADVEPAKIIVGRLAIGSPIVLAPTNDLLGLCVAEGIEDALSVHAATGLGAWASGGATRMPVVADAVPDYIDFVTVVADRDPAGIRYADALADRLRKRGIRCAVSFLEGARPHEGR